MPMYRHDLANRTAECTICHEVYSGANYKNMAIRCYKSHAETRQDANLRGLIGPYDKVPKQPGEGSEFPDLEGHYRRLSPGHPDYNRVELGKARRRLRSFAEGERRAFARWLSERAYPRPQAWKKTISPLQRLAYAFHYGSWEAVKQAAVNYGYSVIIPRILELLEIPETIITDIEMEARILERLETLADLDNIEAGHDVQKVIDALTADNWIEDALDEANDGNE